MKYVSHINQTTYNTDTHNKCKNNILHNKYTFESHAIHDSKSQIKTNKIKSN
jgi:hypothetical protein